MRVNGHPVKNPGRAGDLAGALLMHAGGSGGLQCYRCTSRCDIPIYSCPMVRSPVLESDHFMLVILGLVILAAAVVAIWPAYWPTAVTSMR